jgi:hypothetical protein
VDFVIELADIAGPLDSAIPTSDFDMGVLPDSPPDPEFEQTSTAKDDDEYGDDL